MSTRSVCFTAASLFPLALGANAQGIEQVEISTVEARIDGVPGSDFGIGFQVETDFSITSVSVTPPGGSAIPLAFDVDEGFIAFFEGFASLTSLRTQFPLGNYLFEFNGGVNSILLPYADFEPSGFADLASPTHLGVASTTPTISWTVCGGCPGDGALDVSLDHFVTEDNAFEVSFQPPTSGSISIATSTAMPAATTPLPPQTPLIPGDAYIIGIDVVSGALTFESVGGDGFEYLRGFRKDLDALFTVASDSVCNGDGGDQMGCSDCPCANNATAGTIGGCLNSAGTSTRLLRSGSTSVAAADLRFEASGAPPANSAVLTSGGALAPANLANPCFGLGSGIQSVNLDGLRCAVQGVLRHGVRPSDANGDIGVTTNGWGTPNGFFNFNAFVAGQGRYFQIVHRDDSGAVCMTGQNTSQAVSVVFGP